MPHPRADKMTNARGMGKLGIQCCAEALCRLVYLLGSLGNDDDDGRENVTKRGNLRPFKLYRVYLEPLNLSLEM